MKVIHQNRGRAGGDEIREPGGGWGMSLKGLFILRAWEPQGPEIKLVLQRPLSQTWEPGGLAFRGETGGWAFRERRG